MKTYHERAQDILARLEIYEKQKQKRQKRLYTGLALAACLAMAVCAAAFLPLLLHRPERPSPPHSQLPSVSVPATQPPVTQRPESSDPGVPQASMTRENVSFREAKQALGWNMVPCEDEEFLGYVLLSLDKPRRPVGLIYQFRNGSVQILSDAREGEGELGIRRVSYRGREFLVPAGTAETTALYREGNLTYRASFTGVTQEETFESILSLLIS